MIQAFTLSRDFVGQYRASPGTSEEFLGIFERGVLLTDRVSSLEVMAYRWPEWELQSTCFYTTLITVKLEMIVMMWWLVQHIAELWQGYQRRLHHRLQIPSRCLLAHYNHPFILCHNPRGRISSFGESMDAWHLAKKKHGWGYGQSSVTTSNMVVHNRPIRFSRFVAPLMEESTSEKTEVQQWTSLLQANILLDNGHLLEGITY